MPFTPSSSSYSDINVPPTPSTVDDRSGPRRVRGAPWQSRAPLPFRTQATPPQQIHSVQLDRAPTFKFDDDDDESLPLRGPLGPIAWTSSSEDEDEEEEQEYAVDDSDTWSQKSDGGYTRRMNARTYFSQNTKSDESSIDKGLAEELFPELAAGWRERGAGLPPLGPSKEKAKTQAQDQYQAQEGSTSSQGTAHGGPQAVGEKDRDDREDDLCISAPVRRGYAQRNPRGIVRSQHFKTFQQTVGPVATTSSSPASGVSQLKGISALRIAAGSGSSSSRASVDEKSTVENPDTPQHAQPHPSLRPTVEYDFNDDPAPVHNLTGRPSSLRLPPRMHTREVKLPRHSKMPTTLQHTAVSVLAPPRPRRPRGQHPQNPTAGEQTGPVCWSNLRPTSKESTRLISTRP